MMIKKLCTTFLALCLAGTLAGSAADAPSPQGPAAVQVDQVFAEWDSTTSPGCSLGVYRDGEIAYARGYGMANLEYGLANSPQTVFRIGSTSKQFSAMALALLAEEGALSLGDDPRKHLPELADYGAAVTLRHLVHHTSGLRDYLTLADLAEMGDDYSIAEALALVARQKELNTAPGERFLYSNSNYFLLSQIVERATGQSLREWADENMFRPLGMKDTHFHDDYTHIVKNRADGHAPADGGGYKLLMTTLDMVGDGGIYTTVLDLLLWDRNFYDNKLGQGGPALIETVETTGKLNDGEDTAYAFGLDVGEHRGVRRIGHGGSFVGYRSEIQRFPDERLTVAVLCNLATIDPGPLALQVAELYLGDAMEPVAEAPPAPPPAYASRKELKRLAGFYWSESSARVRGVRFRDGRLFYYDRGDGEESQLVPVGEGAFRVPGLEAVVEVRFEPAGADPERMVVTRRERPPIHFAPFAPAEPSDEELRGYAGRYRSEELARDFVLEARPRDRGSEELANLELVLTVRRRNGDVELRPLFTDTFTGDGLVVRFERDAEGGVAGFVLDAGRVLNLRFVRSE